MGLLIKIMLVMAFVVSPYYLLNTLVMPALDDLAKTYSSFDETAQNIANAKN